MNNNDVWAVLSILQTLGRPFCEQLSDNNWRRFGVPTRLPQPFVSATQQRESDSKIPLSFEISGTVTQLRAAQRGLYWVAGCLHRRDRNFSMVGSQCAAWIVIYKIPQLNCPLLSNLSSPWSPWFTHSSTLISNKQTKALQHLSKALPMLRAVHLTVSCKHEENKPPVLKAPLSSQIPCWKP